MVRAFAVGSMFGLVAATVALSGCFWWGSSATPHEAHAFGLSSSDAIAESNLGYALDKVAVADAFSFGAPQTQSSHAGGAAAPGAARADAVRSVARAELTGPGDGARADATVEGVDVLGGVVVAKAVHAQAVFAGNAFDVGGSRFVDLVVAGTPVTDDVAPNTVMHAVVEGDDVTIVLKEVTQTSSTINITMVHVTTSQGQEVLLGNAWVKQGTATTPTNTCVHASSQAAVLADLGTVPEGVAAADAGAAQGSGQASGHAFVRLHTQMFEATAAGAASRADTRFGASGAALLEVHDLHFFGGLVKAKALVMSVEADFDTPATAQATFTDLEVKGVRVPDPVAKNTGIPVTIGASSVLRLVINEQSVTHDAAGNLVLDASAIHLSGTVDGAPVDLALARAHLVLGGGC